MLLQSLNLIVITSKISFMRQIMFFHGFVYISQQSCTRMSMHGTSQTRLFLRHRLQFLAIEETMHFLIRKENEDRLICCLSTRKGMCVRVIFASYYTGVKKSPPSPHQNVLKVANLKLS